jgi:uncharacterized protein (DUF1501 family)
MKPEPYLRIPPRAPRLPRDHFAMRPQLSRVQRVMRAITVTAVLLYCIWWLWVR